jgi:hypothetical protein
MPTLTGNGPGHSKEPETRLRDLIQDASFRADYGGGPRIARFKLDFH